jgi:hypothetical protein
VQTTAHGRPGKVEDEGSAQGEDSLAQMRAPEALACVIVAPRSINDDQQQVVLAEAMSGLVLDRQHPVALEIAGTPAAKQFQLRATTPEALRHAIAQMRTRFPQASVTFVNGTEDPFRRAEGEAVSVVELQGVAPELPLRTLEDRELRQRGRDPVLGLLGALDNLDPGMRAVAQLALVPAQDDWSRAYARKGIEHSLQPERDQKMANLRSRGGATSTAAVFLALGALAVVALLHTLHLEIPAWIVPDLAEMVHGNFGAVPADQLTKLIIGLGVVLFGGFGAFIVVDQLTLRFKKPLYDQRLVAQKIQGPAYRVRLRVYVIGPGARPWHLHLSLAWLRQLRAWLAESKKAIQRTRQELHQQQLAGASGQNQPLIRQLLATLFRLLVAYLHSLAVDLWQWTHALWQEWSWRRSQAKLRRAILAQFVAAYRQWHLARGDYFTTKSLSARRARRYVAGKWGKNVASSQHLLSSDAVASLWHPPAAADLPDMALIESRAVRTQLIPPALAGQSGPIIGVSEHGGYALPVPLPAEMLHYHGGVFGQSGEGKSTFFQHLARAAMERGEGMLVADPHGDLAEDTLRVVPAHRRDDVVFIDLAAEDYAFGLNPIDVTLGRDRDKLISDLLKTFSLLWVSSWGPRMENAFRVALQTLYEANRALVARDPQDGPARQYTLLDVLPLFTRQSFRHALLQDVGDKSIHHWWTWYYEPLNVFKQQDISTPILNKVTEFAGPRTARIVGQGCSTIDFKKLIAARRIIILKLAQGTVGDVAALIGTTILGLLQTTLEEQGQLQLQQRNHLLIFIDEFQALPGMDFQALAQLRKYGATFVLATQSMDYLDQLDRKILPVVFANVKHLTTFRLSAKDARHLSEELELEGGALKNLPVHTCYARWTSQGVRQPAFSFTLRVPLLGDPEDAEEIRRRSRERHTLPVGVVDLRLAEAIGRAERLQPKATGNQAFTEAMADEEDRADATAQTATNQAQNKGKHGDRGRKSEQARKKNAETQAKGGRQPGQQRGSLTAMDEPDLVGTLAESDEETTY